MPTGRESLRASGSVWLVCCALGAFGCGDDTMASGGDATPSDGPRDAAVDSLEDAASGPFGFLAVIDNPFGPSYLAAAAFNVFPCGNRDVPGTSCQLHSVACLGEFPGWPGWTTTLGNLKSAGTLTFSVGSQTFTMTPQVMGGSNVYSSANGSATLWSGGETAHAQAPGDQAPAFDLSLVTPSSVTIAMPPWFTSTTTPSVSRQSPLALQWTGTSAGQLVVVVMSNSNSLQNLRCEFPLSSPSAEIPSAVLGLLPAGSATLWVETSNDATIGVTGGWTVGLRLISYAGANGVRARKDIQLQ